MVTGKASRYFVRGIRLADCPFHRSVRDAMERTGHRFTLCYLLSLLLNLDCHTERSNCIGNLYRGSSYSLQIFIVITVYEIDKFGADMKPVIHAPTELHILYSDKVAARWTRRWQAGWAASRSQRVAAPPRQVLSPLRQLVRRERLRQ